MVVAYIWFLVYSLSIAIIGYIIGNTSKRGENRMNTSIIRKLVSVIRTLVNSSSRTKEEYDILNRALDEIIAEYAKLDDDCR